MVRVGDQVWTGHDGPARSRMHSAGAVGLLLALGAGIGLIAEAGLKQSLGSTVGAAQLTVGAIEPHASRPSWANYVVPLRNDAEVAVEVLSVAPAGWRAFSEPVIVRPGTWARVPIQLERNCESTPPMGREVVVRTGDDERLRLQLPGPPDPIITEHARECEATEGASPTRRQLVGEWRIDHGWTFAGRMLVRFRRDGTYAMNPQLGKFSWSPGVAGTFTLKDGELTLGTTGGGDCQRGDRSMWKVLLLPDSSLHIRWLEQYESWCRVGQGEVWVAQRVRPPYPSTLTMHDARP